MVPSNVVDDSEDASWCFDSDFAVDFEGGRGSFDCCFSNTIGFGGRGMPTGGIGVDEIANPFTDIDIAQNTGSKSMFMAGKGSCAIDMS
jgi:hypothetical protein